jgi:hypothetical protein
MAIALPVFVLDASLPSAGQITLPTFVLDASLPGAGQITLPTFQLTEAGASSFSFTPSGGAVGGGAATIFGDPLVVSGSGGAIGSGTADVIANNVSTLTLTAQGGAIGSGTALVSTNWIEQVAKGGAIGSGTAIVVFPLPPNTTSIAAIGSTAIANWNPVGLAAASAAVFIGAGEQNQAIFVGVTSSAAFASTGSSPTIFFEVVTSSAAVTGVGASIRDIQATVTATAVLNGAVIGQASYFVSAASTAEILSGIQFLQDYWDGWAFNLNTAAASFYENFKFNSFARIGKNYYGCNETGIHLLGGDLDGAAQIDSTITTGTSDLTVEGVGGFKGDIQKRVPYAYISAKSPETMTLTCLVEGQEYAYTFRAPKDKVAVSRVDIGKGLLGTFWQFELKNQNGADFEIDSLSVNPVATTRKI